MPAFSAAPVVDNPSPDISQIISLVDKIVVEQPPDQGAAAVHLQLTSRLGSQLADLRRDLTGEDSRVRPPRVGECGRRYVLGPRVQGRCDGVDARICHCSPDVSKTRQITHDLRTRASLPRARRRGRPSLPGLHEGVYSLPLDPIRSRRLCVCAEVRNG